MSRVKIAGLKRTKNDIVVEQVRDVLKTESLRELLFTCLESARRLEQLNIFRRVSLLLDTDKRSRMKGAGSGAESGQQEVDLSNVKDGDSIEVTFVVKELGWFSSTIAANAGTQSGDAVSTVMWNLSLPPSIHLPLSFLLSSSLSLSPPALPPSLTHTLSLCLLIRVSRLPCVTCLAGRRSSASSRVPLSLTGVTTCSCSSPNLTTKTLRESR